MRASVLQRRQPVDLRRVVHHVPEVQARAGLEITRIEAALEQQDGPAPAELAQQLGLCHIEQCEPVGAAQAFPDLGDAVAIGIGLHDGPDLGARGGAARDLEVGGERFGMNPGNDGPRHGGILPKTRVL